MWLKLDSGHLEVQALNVFPTWHIKLSQDKSYCSCVSFSITLNSLVFTHLPLQDAAVETLCKHADILEYRLIVTEILLNDHAFCKRSILELYRS